MSLFERRSFESWSRFIPSHPARVMRAGWPGKLPIPLSASDSLLPFGLGRSYGDVCLNNGATLVETSALNRFRRFDESTGLLECEAGVTLAEIERLFVPRGWFVPVTPGTKYVTVGGCIANDVHGKNHHEVGTFGRFVDSLELVRSDGSWVRCSAQENGDLFRATIGGLGLTGLIASAELRLRPIASASIDVEEIPFRTLDDFARLSDESAGAFEHTVAWFDALPREPRGIFIRGNHAREGTALDQWKPARSGKVPAPLFSPFMNRLTIGAFNDAYFLAHSRRSGRQKVELDPFFYPLDVLENWNRIYGRHGYAQYQPVIPREAGIEPAKEMLARIHRAGASSYLTVVKIFGDPVSPGLLSFPRPGITLALDFPGSDRGLLRLLESLDDIVESVGGRVYPAKDVRMTGPRFRRFFPQWEEFAHHVDPRFSSSFWRRVTS